MDAGRRLVHEALVVQHAEHVGAFDCAQCTRLRCWCASRPWWRRAATMASVVARSRAAQRSTRGTFAERASQIVDRLVDHHFGSPPLSDAALPVVSCSSSAESFPWTSITLRLGQVGLQARVLTAQPCHLLVARIGGWPPWRSGQRLQRALVTLLAPLGDQRRVQTLTSQQGAFAVAVAPLRRGAGRSPWRAS